VSRVETGTEPGDYMGMGQNQKKNYKVGPKKKFGYGPKGKKKKNWLIKNKN
jgi:hypothetical protein